ncbi:MAG TPA: hypothetical protein VD886_13960 [Herpetosiphonaceae bacterium]|nr:hypothetical protein [Herpetosiphonaceae bacterium]
MTTPADHPRSVPAQSSKRDTVSGPYFKDADILSVLILPTRWEGACPAAAAAGPVVQRFGRWCVTDSAVFALGQECSIPIAALDDGARIEQMVSANSDWFYDPSDFLDAVEFALARQAEPEGAQAALASQAQAALEQGIWPFYPSHVLGHVYLVNRMQDAEVAALNRYLAEQEVAPVTL